MARRRRPWGSVRKLPSGRYQVRYRVDGQELGAPQTFRTKSEADAWLAAARADLERGTWIDPEAGRITLEEYAWRWLAERPNLRPRTSELYESELRLHILPVLGRVELRHLSSARVRSWHSELLAAERPGAPTVAKCYRLLRAVLATAVEDDLVVKNPCVLKGAGVERSAERPVATVEEVYAIAEAIEPRFRALVLLAAFTGLRLGELRALRRNRLDLEACTVHVTEQVQDLTDGTLFFGEPKSEAGRRTVAFPEVLVPELQTHLDEWAGPGPHGLVFCGTRGQPLRRATLHSAWKRATREAGVNDLHFHDLRHTGNTLAAGTGVSTKDLMARLGHSSPRAALIYQHATSDRDAGIARALNEVILAAGRANSVERDLDALKADP